MHLQPEILIDKKIVGKRKCSKQNKNSLVKKKTDYEFFLFHYCPIEWKCSWSKKIYFFFLQYHHERVVREVIDATDKKVES